jgi:O-antigen ligase
MSASLPASRKFPVGIELLRFLGLTAGFSLAAWLSFQFGPETVLAVPFLLAVLALGFLDYPKFLLLAVFIRSTLDAFANSDLSFGPLQLKPAGLLGLSLIFFTVIHGPKIKEALKFWVVKGFFIFLLFSAPAVWTAYLHFGTEGLDSVREMIRLGSVFCLLISLLTIFQTPMELRKLFAASMASLAIPLTVGFYQAVTGTGDTLATVGQNRIFGTLGYPNVFAEYLSVFLAVSLAWHRNSPSLSKKVLIALLLGVLFLTYSVGGLVAAALIIALHFWRTKNFKLLFVGAAFFAIFAFASTNWQTRFEQLAQMELKEEIQTGQITNSFSWRVLHWYILWQHAKEHPIMGWGYLTTEKISPWKTEQGQGYNAHNEFLRLFLETGVVGLFGYFIFLFCTGRWLFNESGGQDTVQATGLSPALKAIFLTHLIISAGAEQRPLHTDYGFYFLTFIALAKNSFSFRYLQPEEKR